MMNDLQWLGIREAGALFRQRAISPVEMTQAIIEWTEKANEITRAYESFLYEEPLREAREAEQALLRGEDIGPMHGITYSVKDVIAVKGTPMKCNSKMIAGFVPTEDAHVVSRLRSAGAVCLGKVATHEFSWGVISSPSRNPWDGTSVPGGSSGGSGAAVAAGQGIGSIGADCGCSVRNPAALNGVCGMRVTHGRVSTTGAVPLSMTMDTVGPLARSAEDIALMLQVIAGHDPNDPTSAMVSVPDFSAKLEKSIQGLKIGVPSDYFFDHMETGVKRAVERTISILEELGGEIREIRMPHAKYAVGAALFATAEWAAWLDEYMPARVTELGVDVRTFVELGNLILAKDYCRAQQVRSLVQRDFLEAFETVNVIVTPTAPATAKRPGDDPVQIEIRYDDGYKEDVVQAYCRYTIPVSLAGCPALAVPCGFSDDGLPASLQIVAPPFGEPTALQVGHQLQKVTDWHLRRPRRLLEAAGAQ